jgi:hypothetical protein
MGLVRAALGLKRQRAEAEALRVKQLRNNVSGKRRPPAGRG